MRRSLVIASAALLASGAAFAATERPQGNFAAGLRAIESQDYRTAIQQLERAIVAQPANADAYWRLAEAHRQSGDLRRAVKYARIALDLEPAHRGALLEEGLAWLAAGDQAQAQATLETLGLKCKQACPEFERLRQALGDKKSASGN
jgi:tetratricopeptide (TPR) repeat protein